mmetsp:Transcript_26643/g.46447  ORF Transcript_26643/g.46447 Transcript_26643/m.46447 type:complete len:346 (-) Transcript_26643:471-1508(-)
MIQDPMSPGLDGLRAINTDGSIVYGVSLAEIVHYSKYKNFGDEGLSALAAGPEIGLHPMSLDFDSRFSHGGLQSSAGLGGGKCIPSPPITSSFDEDGIQMSSTADAEENNTDLSSRGFRDDTLLAALDAPTGPLSGLIPETPPCVAAEFTSRLDDQQLLIEALLLRVNQQNKVIKEQADVISELAASSGCADVSPQLPLMEPTNPSGPGTDDTASPLVIKHKSLDGLKASPAIWHSMMLEYLTPLHAVLEQLLLRPVMGAVGMVDVRAWTFVPDILLLVLGKHTTWGWSWVQSKTYDPGGSCRCALPLRPDVAIMGGGAGRRRTMEGRAGVRPTMGGRAALLWGA